MIMTNCFCKTKSLIPCANKTPLEQHDKLLDRKEQAYA